LAMSHRRNYRPCELCDDKILDEEGFSKLIPWCNSVIECDSLEKRGRKVIVQIVEWSTDPHFHGTKQIEHCRCKGCRSCHSDFPPLVTRAPLPDCRWSERNADQECVIRRVSWSLLSRPWTRAKSRHGELGLLVRALQPAIVVRRAKDLRQRRSEHARDRVSVAARLLA